MAPRRTIAPHRIEAEIASLAHLGLDELQHRWRRFAGRDAPVALKGELLRRGLAYQLQLCSLGGFDRATARLLDRLAQGEAPGEILNNHARPSAQAGGIYVREWRGVEHRVTALEQGFEWNGSSYRSLSAVAKAITGTSWNGRRFFGLNGTSARTGRGM